MNDIVKLAVDGFRGSVEKYSIAQSQELLRKALIEANNGKEHFDYKDIRDGKCAGLFTLIEDILSQTVIEGLMDSDFFNELVEYRNVAEGDSNVFTVKDSELFTVAKAADGTQAIRRQRLGGYSTAQIPTQMRYIRIYEELNRVLSGRIDFNEMIQKVSESFKQEILNDNYSLLAGVTANQIGSTYLTSGSFTEANLIALIEHVEAVSGQVPMIVGTKSAVRHLSASAYNEMPMSAKEERYNTGYYGKFYACPIIAVPQRHKVGSTTFAFDNDELYVIASGVKPIKCVYEGSPIVLMGNPMDNMDLTQEFLYGEKWGCGIVLAGGTDGGDNLGFAKYDVTSWS